MCGRFVVYGLMDDIVKAFNARKFLSVYTNYAPNYNVSPEQNAPVVTNSNEENFIELMRWGLIPSWAKDDKSSFRMINARAESVSQKPSYAKPFRTQRCLVVANGFYEWKDKMPNYITLKDRKLFGMAGLYDEWINEGKALRTFSIITTTPNKFMENIHDRMPVIIAKNDEKNYLEDAGIAKSLLQPSDEEMQSWRVDNRMNSPQYNEAGCITPLVDLKSY